MWKHDIIKFQAWDHPSDVRHKSRTYNYINIIQCHLQILTFKGWAIGRTCRDNTPSL